MKIHFNYLFLTLLFSTLACTIQEEEPPNIIVFLVDDMGWQDTSVPFWTEETMFNRRYHTPSMERLASEGMKFTQAYATPVCTPTRVSLISGMNAARHRVTNWTLRRNTHMVKPPEGLHMPNWNSNGAQPTDSIENAIHITPLPQLLKDNGYHTIHVGKAHFGALDTPGADPTNLGFDVNIAGHAAGAPASYYGKSNFANPKRPQNIWNVPGLEKYHGKDIYLSEALTLEAKLAMQQAIDMAKPFYLYMAHYAVHTPIQGDPRFEAQYVENGLHPIEARYASMIEGMDKSLGDLMNFLDERGIADNTIILFMSDNGGLSAVARGGEPHTHNKPLSSGKGSLREGGIREPMLVKWPGIVNPGSSTDVPVIIEDYFPTVLEMAGIAQFETVQIVDGQSFIPILKDENKSSSERSLVWHYPNHWGPTGPGIAAASVIRKGDWKLIYYHKGRKMELFNLAEDIGEAKNLSYSHSDETLRLAKALSDYLRSVDAQMPTYTETGKKVPWPDDPEILNAFRK
jgi:arylsulfatase A-like enzyme